MSSSQKGSFREERGKEGTFMPPKFGVHRAFWREIEEKEEEEAWSPNMNRQEILARNGLFEVDIHQTF